MSWIIIVLIIVGVIWLVKRNKNSPQQPNQTRLSHQNMPQNSSYGSSGRPSGMNTSQQQRPMSAGNRQCPYCAKVVGVQEAVCQSCGAKLPVLSQQGNAASNNGQTQQGKTVLGNSQIHQGGNSQIQQGRGGSVLGDAVKTGAAVIATQAILGGLMGQGQAQAGNQMPPDPSMMPGAGYPDEADSSFGGILGNEDDNGSPFGNVLGNDSNDDNPLSGVFGGGLGSLDNLGDSDDSNNSAAWVTDENDSGNTGSWASSNDDSSSLLGNWSFDSNDDSDSGSSWSFSDDDSDVGSSWSFSDDD